MGFSNKLLSGFVLCGLVFLTGCIKNSESVGHSKKQGSCKAHECKNNRPDGYSYGEKCFVAEKTIETAEKGVGVGLTAGVMTWIGSMISIAGAGTVSEEVAIGTFIAYPLIGAIIGGLGGGTAGYYAAKHDVDNKCEHDCFCKYGKKRFRFFT